MSGALIKAGDFKSASRGMYRLELRDIAGQAERIMAEARAQAEILLDRTRGQAVQDREVHRQEGQKTGYEAGFKEGREVGYEAALAEARQRFEQDHAALTSALQELTQGFEARRERFYQAARRDAVVLSIVIASRLIKTLTASADVAASTAVDACAEALEMIGEATAAEIRVNPADAEALTRHCEAQAGRLQASKHLRLVEDASIERGGVIVETADGAVDSQVSTRVERIAQELAAEWRRRSKALSLES